MSDICRLPSSSCLVVLKSYGLSWTSFVPFSHWWVLEGRASNGCIAVCCCHCLSLLLLMLLKWSLLLPLLTEAILVGMSLHCNSIHSVTILQIRKFLLVLVIQLINAHWILKKKKRKKLIMSIETVSFLQMTPLSLIGKI